MKTHEHKPFALLGVNSDQDLEEVRQVVKDKKLTWRSWHDGSPAGPISTAWKVRGWPTTYVIDAKGIIRGENVRGKALDRLLHELLLEAPSPADDGTR